MDLWFTEDYHDGWQLSVRVDRVLATETSRYQRIDVLQTRDFGKMLVIDGRVQACELDEFVYHEMIVHPALLCHENPRRVLVAGGGDGGSMREVMKHPTIETGYLVEIDERVIELCREHMPNLATKDPRIVDHPADAAEFLNQVNDLDMIVVDSSDPVGPAEALFSKTFYNNLKKALAPQGMVTLQAGSPFFYKEQIRQMIDDLKTIFPVVRPYNIPMPTYPSGTWTLVAASTDLDPACVPQKELERRLRERTLKTRYYSPAVHHGSMSLPPFMDQ